MKNIKSIVVLVVLGFFVSSAQASWLYLMNKTNDRIAYKYEYFKVGKKVATGALDPGQYTTIKSIRGKSLELYPVDAGATSSIGSSIIVSIKGDRRVRHLCSALGYKKEDCFNNYLGMRNARLEGGKLLIDHKFGLESIERATLLAITQSEKLKKQGKIGYLLTELKDYKLKNKPKPFFFDLLGNKSMGW